MSDYKSTPLPIAEILIPTTQYGNIRFIRYQGTDQEIIDETKRLIRLYAEGPKKGLEHKEWNSALDSLNMGHACSQEQFEGMSDIQYWAYHQQELSIGRITPKE